MIEFLNHAMSYPTIMPFGFMILCFMFFVVSISFGFDHDVSADTGADMGDVSSGGFFYFLGVKRGVPMMPLLLISFFFNFAFMFFISEYVDLDSTLMKKALGLALFIGLFVVLNNIVYVMLRPLSKAMSASHKAPIGILGKSGKVLKYIPEKRMLFLDIENFEQMAFVKEEDLACEYNVGDEVEVIEESFVEGTKVYYVKKVIK